MRLFSRVRPFTRNFGTATISPGDYSQGFLPPGFANDFTPAGRASWSKKISGYMDSSQVETDGSGRTRTQWFNPVKTGWKGEFATKDIDWVGFPKRIAIEHPDDDARWAAADSSRAFQDEYLEWSVTRNSKNKITKVSFTSEGPEYWTHLAQDNPKQLLALYRQFISPAVKESELFVRGKYNEQNKWNRNTRTGAMHLIQEDNSLQAEIELGAGATVVRKVDGEIYDNPQDLINCSSYGRSQRNSDPHIGALVNSLARQGAIITLANPVALYIKGLDTTGWVTPDGSNPSDYWIIERGVSTHILRAKYEVPASKGFTVSDIKLSSGISITWGSQIADFIRVHLIGLARDINPKNIDAFEYCVGDAPSSVAAAAVRRATR